MMILGLTGQTGAGKSTVSQILQKYGCYHIDADLVAREIIDNDEKLKSELTIRFGEDIIADDGKINRKILGTRAFADPQSTLDLNSITHPAVNRKIQSIIAKKEAENVKAVIIDAIALFESGEDKLCDYTVAVIAPKELRRERIILRDKITKEKADERINAQKGEEFFSVNADYIIKNYEPYNINEETDRLAEILKLKPSGNKE